MPNKTKLTVVCQEDHYESVLIYVVEVKDPHDHAEVQAAVQDARNDDLGEDTANHMEILFAFAGDLAPIEDWRQ